jgi:phosphoribosylanthranilate isomerase
MLTQTVKISNVTNLSDARYCAGMGVEMLGFSIDESSQNYIAPKKFEEICSWISGISLVAETQETNPENIILALNAYPVQAIQIEHMDMIPYLAGSIEHKIILRVSADTYDHTEISSIVNRYSNDVAYFLVESESNALLTTEWLQALGTLSEDHAILVGFGLENETDVAKLTEQYPNIGIALRGSEEIRPGYKDFGSMMDILEALEA